MNYIYMARFCRPKSGYSPPAMYYSELDNGDCSMKRLNIISGEKINRLTLVREIEPIRYKSRVSRAVVCECDCGNIIEVTLNNWRSGSVKSCGCLQTEKAREASGRHLLSNHRLYSTWNCMIGRCYCKKNTGYKYYGARGIDVCLEWRSSPAKFIEWAEKNGWSSDLEIDRIDNDKGYSPENCRIVTHAENMRNRRISKKEIQT